MIRRSLSLVATLALAGGVLTGCAATGPTDQRFANEPVSQWPSQQVLRQFPDSSR